MPNLHRLYHTLFTFTPFSQSAWQQRYQASRARKITTYPLLLSLVYTSIITALWPQLAEANTIADIPYTVISSAPHNPKAFTQGWIKEGNTFYESSGLYGKSFITRYSDSHHSIPTSKDISPENVQPKTPVKNLPKLTLSLANHYFAEGLTLFNDTLYLLTWKKQTLLLIDKNSFAIKKTLAYQGEGWGLTHNKTSLIMSNGSSTLFFRDPNDFTVQKTLEVKHLKAMNELEYVNGIIWANEWNDDSLYAINSNSGCILGKINLATLRGNTVIPSASNILNGIAYDQEYNGLWITGKFWPKRYLIQPRLQQSESC